MIFLGVRRSLRSLYEFSFAHKRVSILLLSIPDAKFIEQDDITDLRDIIAHSTLPAFATDYTEHADHLPALKKTSRVAVPIEDEEVNVKFYAVCRGEMMRQLNSVRK